MEENGRFTRGEKKGQRERRRLGTLAGQGPPPFDVQVGQRASQARAQAGCRAGVKLGVGIRQHDYSRTASHPRPPPSISGLCFLLLVLASPTPSGGYTAEYLP